MGIDRAIPVEVHQRYTIEHKRNNGEMIELARQLAQELGLDPQKLIGVNREAAPILDAEYTEVKDAKPASAVLDPSLDLNTPLHAQTSHNKTT